MRILLLISILLLADRSEGQILLNELQAANRNTVVEADGSTPDWIELFNAGSGPVDLLGMRLAVVGRQHVMEQLIVAPGEHRLLWFDGRPELGPDHIGYTLPRKGGTLLLISADGANIQDVFTYPAMAGDLSVGRCGDTGRDWSFFFHATPGSPNQAEGIIQGRTRIPERDLDECFDGPEPRMALVAEEGAVIRYTLDGTEPTGTNGHTYSGPLSLDRDLVVRARAFMDGKLPSQEFCETYMRAGAAVDGITIAMDGGGLTADSTGINVEGALANFSRRGRTWERLAMVKFNGSDDAPIPIGISIHGSGTRSLPKRSFKLRTRDRYDSPVEGLELKVGTYFQEGILRADAGEHAFLRNRFLERLVEQHELRVDVQASKPMPLYLNGRYWGLYRWMPPKDAQWIERISGADAVDVLEGPAASVCSGSDKHFAPAMERLFALAPLDSIARYIDVASLIDLACLDLYTGRADHDLNVRCYRPRRADGRWRWVLFDMDLWAPYDENSLERMASATGPETPYVPQLLQQEELRSLLLSRMSALLATVLSPEQAEPLARSTFEETEVELRKDHARWHAEMPRPSPDSSLHALLLHIEQRPGILLKQLTERTGRRSRRSIIDVPSPELGQVLIDGLPLRPGKHRYVHFDGITSNFTAVPADGIQFIGWHGTNSASPEISIVPGRVIRPLFAPVVP